MSATIQSPPFEFTIAGCLSNYNSSFAYSGSIGVLDGKIEEQPVYNKAGDYYHITIKCKKFNKGCSNKARYVMSAGDYAAIAGRGGGGAEAAVKEVMVFNRRSHEHHECDDTSTAGPSKAKGIPEPLKRIVRDRIAHSKDAPDTIIAGLIAKANAASTSAADRAACQYLYAEDCKPDDVDDEATTAAHVEEKQRRRRVVKDFMKRERRKLHVESVGKFVDEIKAYVEPRFIHGKTPHDQPVYLPLIDEGGTLLNGDGVQIGTGTKDDKFMIILTTRNLLDNMVAGRVVAPLVESVDQTYKASVESFPMTFSHTMDVRRHTICSGMGIQSHEDAEMQTTYKRTLLYWARQSAIWNLERAVARANEASSSTAAEGRTVAAGSGSGECNDSSAAR